MTARRVALLLALLCGIYLLAVAGRGLALLGDDRPVVVLFGVGVLLLPLVGAWIVLAELRFGRAAERLGRDLGATGGLPLDERPRTGRGRPGRVDRARADAVFTARRAEVEADPADWRAWYRLAVAYADAGDTSRGRRAMRRAIALHAGRR